MQLEQLLAHVLRAAHSAKAQLREHMRQPTPRTCEAPPVLQLLYGVQQEEAVPDSTPGDLRQWATCSRRTGVTVAPHYSMHR